MAGDLDMLLYHKNLSAADAYQGCTGHETAHGYGDEIVADANHDKGGSKDCQSEEVSRISQDENAEKHRISKQDARGISTTQKDLEHADEPCEDAAMECLQTSETAQSVNSLTLPRIKLSRSISEDSACSRTTDSTTWPLTKLCSRCQGIFHIEHPEAWYASWHEHGSLINLIVAALRIGCELCLYVLQRLMSSEYNPWQKEVNLSYTTRYFRDNFCRTHVKYQIYDGHPGRTLRFACQKAGETNQGLYLFFVELQLLSSAELIRTTTMRKVARLTNTHATWELCRKWLATCQNTHSECGGIFNGQNFQPSRLVHVSVRDGKLHACLHCRPEVRTAAAYLTLSHCWGARNFFVLKHKNIDALEKNIPIRKLIAVIRHALIATVELGFNFLWIDALCIVQDCKQDWLRESGQMGAIYKYAGCNLAATGFKDGKGGMFLERDPDAFRLLRMKTQWLASWQDGISRADDFYCVEWKMWHSQVAEAPLNRRAWVLQERSLSPRTLHFGAHQLFWECHRSRKCEEFPDGIPAQILVDLEAKYISFWVRSLPNVLHNAVAPKDSLVGGSLRGLDHQKIHTAWLLIIETYSHCHLTYSSDELVALSGLAEEVAQITNDSYHAGIWRSDFHRGLLWGVRDNGEILAPMPQGFAPSWSWASHYGRVNYYAWAHLFDLEEGSQSTIVDVSTNARLADEEYISEEGFVQIRGPLATADIVERSDSRGAPEEAWRINDRIVEIWPMFDYCHCNRYSQTFHLLPLRLTTSSESHHTTGCGLVLSPTTGPKGHFVRVGIFEAETHDARSVISGPSRKLPRELYEECFETPEGYRYTIKIV